MALAFYPPSRRSLAGASGGQPSVDGIHELAAPSRYSTTVTSRLVVSYTTFSPLPPSISNCQLSISNYPLSKGRLFSSTVTCCHQQLPLSEVGCPVLPGLSSRALQAPAADRGSVFWVQSYEKSSAKQKNSFIFLPRRSNFATFVAKLRKVESKTKEIHFFFLPRRSKFALIERKVTKKACKSEAILED